MTRQVTGTIALAEGATASFTLCDRYERSLAQAPVTCVVGAGGIFSVVLTVTDTRQCYTVMTDIGKKVLWVYEGATSQTVDLRADNYPRNAIDVFVTASYSEAVDNASRVMEGIVCGYPIINEEEQRFMCRYENYAAGEEDKEMCIIDAGIGGVNG